MIRRPFTAASVLSLGLGMAVVGVWPRSLQVADKLAYTTASDTSCSFGTAPGRLDVLVIRNLPPVAPELRDQGFPQAQRGWSSSSVRWRTPARTFSLPPQVTPTSAGQDVSVEAISVAQEWIPPAHGVLEIGWGSNAYAVGPPIWTRSANVRAARLVVPLWLVLAVAAVLPTVWLAGRVRAHRRHRQGRCPACGYDLRASTGRCPECGTPIPTEAKG